MRVNGQTSLNPSARAMAGDRVEIAVPVPQDIETPPQAIALDIRYEDADLVVIDKPAGMAVHPAPGTVDGTLVNALLHHFGAALSGVGGTRRPGIVHRIDKGTSGLVVVAKNDAAHHGLAGQFKAHSVHRRYMAICHGVPNPTSARLRAAQGVSFEANGVVKLATRLARHRTCRQRQAVVFAGGRAAVTRVRVVETIGAGTALIECWLETGRTHQIRVHLAHAGHALIGDPVYGGRRWRGAGQHGTQAATAFTRQALHAAELGFTHPVRGHDLRFAAALPDDMARLLSALRA